MSNGYDADRGVGWILFAGIMLLIAGCLNTIGGIAAIDNANFYAGDADFQIADLSTWGWFLLVVGLAQLVAAFSIWSGGSYGRVVGIASASANAFIQLMFIPAFPLWSLALFGIDLLVIYGLAVYGGKQAA